MPLHIVASGIAPKVAKYKDSIYVVFANNNKIWLVTSGDGISWTSPQLISALTPTASDPAIVMLDDGTRIITWKTGNSIWYSYNNSCLAVSGLVKLPYFVVDYDIAKTGNQIHLVFADAFSIRYAAFPGAVPPSGGGSETVETTTLCNSNSFLNHPAIAAQSTPSGPEVVVAYYFYTNEPQSCSPPSLPPPPAAGPFVKKRTGPFVWTGLSDFVIPITNSSLVTTPKPYSLSLSVGNGGVYFFAASDIVNSVSRAMLARGKISSGWAQNTTTYPANLSKVMSVAARGGQPDYYTLAYTLLQLPPNYDSTSKQVFAWPISLQGPSWGGSLLLDTKGKNARATDIRVCNGPNLCVLSSIFERKVGNNSPEIMSDAVCGKSNTCPPPPLGPPPC
jgi:hypothetical protein